MTREFFHCALIIDRRSRLFFWVLVCLVQTLLGIGCEFCVARIQVQDRGPEAAIQKTEFAAVEGHSIGIAEVRFLLSTLQPIAGSDQQLLKQWAEAAASVEQVPPESEVGSENQTTLAIPKNIIDAVVEKWIQRLVVLSFLEKNDLAISEAQAESDVRRQEAAFREAGTNLDAYLRRTGISRESYIRHRRWQLSWQEYMAKKLTEESLQKYFELNRAHYDGTELNVAQIVLLKSPVDGTPNALDRQEAEAEKQGEKLNKLRKELLDGKLTFSEAAAEHSQGASAKQGGQLGWIGRTGPMVEAFNHEVFSLENGQLSKPFRTIHGVHLVKLLGIRKGEIRYLAVKERVRNDAVADLWRLIVAKHEENVSIWRLPR